MFKNYFKNSLVVPVVLIGLSFAACNKDNAVQQEIGEKAQVEALREFLAEKRQLDLCSIVFDQESRKFLFPWESGEYTFQLDYDSLLETYNRDKNPPSQ